MSSPTPLDAGAAGDSAAMAATSTAIAAPARAFRFSGRAREFFGIWAVNLLLTVATLGLYSAWAKVRTRRYFYRHTAFAGERFDYHAKPTAILLGRLVASALAALYLMVAWLAPGWELIPAAGTFLATPWLLTMGARFNARNSSYRNVRFSFSGRLKPAYAAFVGWPILGLLTLGLMMPISLHRQARWKLDNHRFGSLPFRFDTATAPYFGLYWKAIGLTLLGGFTILAIIVGAVALGAARVTVEGGQATVAQTSAVLPAYAALILGYTLAGAYFVTRSMKIGLGTSTLGGHPFVVTMRARDVMWLYATNNIAILLTFGLALPWAKVRTARYQLQHIALCIDEWTIQRVVAKRSADASAIGQEVAEAFDVDVDFGI
ncbi:MAG: YjgN family protein [Pseudomonadota bacterium]